MLSDQCIELGQPTNQLKSILPFCVEKSHKTITTTACRTRSRLVGQITSQVAFYDLRQAPQVGIETFDHCRVGSFLRSELISRTFGTKERIIDVGRDNEACFRHFFWRHDSRQAAQTSTVERNIAPCLIQKTISDGRSQRDATLSRRTASKSNQNFLKAFLCSQRKQSSCSKIAGFFRIPQVHGQLRDTGSARQPNHCAASIAQYTPFGATRAQGCINRLYRAQSSLSLVHHQFHEPLAAVGQM